MKESWIRKLKNILNEYEDYKEEKFWKRDYKWICYWKENPRISADRTEWNWANDCLFEDESRAIIISKGYNFIKWLVDNDKISFEKDKYWMILYENWVQKFLKSEEEILIELSIQDNPIEFLCSVLK